jgi:hypothetical protein
MDFMRGFCALILCVNFVRGFCAWILCVDLLREFCVWILCVDFVREFCAWILCEDFVRGFMRGYFAWISGWILCVDFVREFLPEFLRSKLCEYLRDLFLMRVFLKKNAFGAGRTATETAVQKMAKKSRKNSRNIHRRINTACRYPPPDRLTARSLFCPPPHHPANCRTIRPTHCVQPLSLIV